MDNNEEKMEQWNDVKEKKSNPLMLIVICFIILVFGGFIFINKDKLFSNNKDKKTEETKKEEETITFTEEELQEYVNLIDPISMNGPTPKLYNVDKINASQLSAKEKIEYIGPKVLSKATTDKDNTYTYKTISEEDLKKVVEEVYGPNTYERTDFELGGCQSYIFNEEDNTYHSKFVCGGSTVKSVNNLITDYKATKNKLEITTAYAFLETVPKFTIYKDFDCTEKLAEYDENDHSKTDELLKNYIKENKDALNHMVYVFESTDGKNYYFKEITNKR